MMRFVAAWMFLSSYAAGLPSFYYSCTFNFTGGARLPHAFCNASLPLARRLDDLVARMTYEEKCASLDTHNPAVPRLGIPSMPSSESTHGVSSGCGKPSGPNSTGCPTSFPSGPGLGATFNRKLWSRVGGIIGIESRGLNNQGVAGGPGSPGNPSNGPSGIYFLDPNINLCRDPRWGRCQEVPGEDPKLTSEYAVNLIRGTQRSDLDRRYLLAAATAKHFSMYDMEGYHPRTDPQPPPPSGHCDTPGGCQRWNFDMTPPARDFDDYYLVPFKAAVQAANVSAIMCSYNAAYGKPTCADSASNNGMVRGEWGFDGFFVSDCTALELMGSEKWDDCPHPWPSEGGNCTPVPFPSSHNYTHTMGDTVHAALAEGGIDYNCGALYKTNLYVALQQGAVTHADIDQAIRRVYKVHFMLGMMDPMESQPLVHLERDVVDSAESREVALQAALESIVLLKNDRPSQPATSNNNNNGTIKNSNSSTTTTTTTSKGLLPLSASGSGSIALIGPHANSTQSLLSNYHGTNTLVNTHSALQVATAMGLDVTYSLGVHICNCPYGTNKGFPNEPCPHKLSDDRAGIPDAVAVAKAADVAVVMVGLDQTSEAENFDRSTISLPSNQEDLIDQVLQVQPNTVVVLVHGGAIASNAIKDKVPAVLTAHYPGQLGGDAIMATLLGHYNPAGRLPYTAYYSNITERDIRTTDLRAQGGITHLWFKGPVMFPFGHGLSYTTFSYEWTADTTRRLQPTYRAASFGTNYSLAVTNTGHVAGDCVVLVFASATPDSHVGMPNRRLINFDRLKDVQPGELRTFVWSVTATDLSFSAPGATDEETVTVRAVGRVVLEAGDLEEPAKHEFAVL